MISKEVIFAAVFVSLFLNTTAKPSFRRERNIWANWVTESWDTTDPTQTTIDETTWESTTDETTWEVTTEEPETTTESDYNLMLLNELNSLNLTVVQERKMIRFKSLTSLDDLDNMTAVAIVLNERSKKWANDIMHNYINATNGSLSVLDCIEDKFTQIQLLSRQASARLAVCLADKSLEIYKAYNKTRQFLDDIINKDIPNFAEEGRLCYSDFFCIYVIIQKVSYVKSQVPRVTREDLGRVYKIKVESADCTTATVSEYAKELNRVSNEAEGCYYRNKFENQKQIGSFLENK